MDPVYKGHEFEALRLRYEDQVELLRALTNLDMKIFTGFITVQLVLGGWISAYPISDVFVQTGLFLIDIVFAFLAGRLLYNQFKRRKEVINTVKNLNEALGFNKSGTYLPDRAINATSSTRPWFWWYIIGICVATFGLSLILFGATPLQEQSNKAIQATFETAPSAVSKAPDS